MVSRRTERILWFLGIVAPLVIWAAYARFSGNELVPGPLDVLLAFPPMIRSGELPLAMWQSAQVLVGGFVAGAVPGLVVGLLIGRFRSLYYALDPYISALYAVPTIALVPILIVAIGWGPPAKIVIIGLLVFLPVCINATVGMREAPRDLLELARAFCSTEWQTWRDVYIPAALPAILPGLRIAVGRALTGLIVAEFSTSLTGLGNVIQMHARNFEVAMSLVPVVVLLVVGFLLYRLLDAAEARLRRSSARS